MEFFLETTETILEGLGFKHYDSLHLAWIAIFIAVTLLSIRYYRNASETDRAKWRKTMAVLLVGNELFKMICLTLGGNYQFSYLPLHLCSINIFVIAYHAWKPNRLLDSILYTVCIPGALAAILFPSWTKLPLMNFMHIHSFTVHIELALYPIVLTAAGEIHPKLSDIPKCIGMLMAAAVPIYFINLLLGTNFMFLMEADANNPLYVFEQLFGSHLWGFPIIITAILIIMFTPWHLYDKRKEKLSHQAH